MEYARWSHKKRAAYIEGFVSILVNTGLFFVKYIAGSAFNSIAVIADAFHTLSDSLTSAVLVIGYRVADRPADREHPFGHGRAETVGGLVIGVLLFVVAYNFALSSYEKLVSGSSLEYSDLLVLVLAVSTLAKAGLSLWAYRLGDKLESRPIVADAWHHVSDSIAACLLGLAIYFGRALWWLDAVLGIAVSVIIFLTAMRITYEAATELLGKAPTIVELDRLMEAVKESHPLAGRAHHVHFHKYGNHIEVTLHIKLPGETTLKEAHEVATAVENEVRSKLGYEVTVHVEPGELVENHVD